MIPYGIAMGKRDTVQVVVILGHGEEGEKLRDVLYERAKDAGVPFSTWARGQLLALVGEGPEDPLVELDQNPEGGERAIVDLRSVAAIQQRTKNTIMTLLNGSAQVFYTDDPEGIISRWRRVHRWTATRAGAA